MKTIAERLHDWRKDRLSLFEAAHILGVKSITTLVSWEKGKTQPTGNNLLAVERELAAWEKQTAEK